MNILFLSNRIPFPIRDGHSRRTYNILKGLAQKHDVYLLSMFETAEEISAETIHHLKSFCALVEAVPAPPKKVGIPMLIRLLRSLMSCYPYTVWRHYSPQYHRRMHELVRTNTFDLVHCDILPLAYALRKLKQIPRTLTDHDVCYLKTRRIAEQSRSLFLKLFSYFESRKLKRYERTIFRQVNMGIAVSTVDKGLLEEICPQGNFVVIENGVNTKDFTPAVAGPENSTLLWVGGFGYAPNRTAVHFFLESIYPAVKREIPEVKFNILGASVTDTIKRYAAQDTSINLLGYAHDVIPHVQSATVFVAPILSGSGTRLKILEAMAAGKPVVTTSIGCEGIDGMHGVHYLIADDPRQFANNVIYLLRNPDVRRRLAINARALAIRQYDWVIIMEKMHSAYANFVPQKMRPVQPAKIGFQRT